MNWDQKLIAENETLGGTTDLLMDHAIAGAHWMRRQLRTDEAVERVAKTLHDRMYDTLAEITYPTGETVPESTATETRYRRSANAEHLAHTVITTLLGDRH